MSDSGASPHSRQFDPAPALAGIVSGYSSYAYSHHTGAPRRRMLIPNTVATVNFGFGAPVRTRSTAGADNAGDALSRVDLPATAAVFAEHEGDVRGVVVRMRPMGAYQLFGIPMSEWRQPHFDPSHLLPRALRFLPEQLEAAQIQGRGRLLDGLLSGLLGHGRRVAPEVLWAWHELHRTRGRISVGQLAVGALSSARHLERRFREQVGRTPGEIARILRFRNALRLQARGLPLHSVAELAGFHDQAHFNHVVKATTGLTPTQLPLHDSLEWSAEPETGPHS
ncbi:helix-turn-helix domain-containing protein [Streptomyces vinaceus]|uniref:helix-turn-helix domain-containing protein n=1 Tax=Streptomyces vinaceus TaxID=1960 RepID=UPI0038220499